jgi:hypothetical protein
MREVKSRQRSRSSSRSRLRLELARQANTHGPINTSSTIPMAKKTPKSSIAFSLEQKSLHEHGEFYDKIRGFGDFIRSQSPAPAMLRQPSLPLPLALDDGDVTIDGKIGEAFDQAAGLRPLDFEPVDRALVKQNLDKQFLQSLCD